MPGVSFHDLRRANATALVLDGVDLKTAQTRLGHSDPRLTLAVYAQATTEADKDAAERLGHRFFGAVLRLTGQPPLDSERRWRWKVAPRSGTQALDYPGLLAEADLGVPQDEVMASRST